MKRIEAFLIIASLLVIQTAARPACAGAEINAGVKAGPSFASQVTSRELAPGVAWSSRTGFAIGAYAELSLNSWLWLRAEPMYAQKGTEVDWPPDIPWDNVQKLDYVTIPLNVKAGLSRGNLRPFIFVGPNIGRIISQGTEFKEEYPGRVVEIEYKDWELALDLGAGTDVLLGSAIGLTLDVRYSLGLTDVESSIKNRAVLLLAGLFVRL